MPEAICLTCSHFVTPRTKDQEDGECHIRSVPQDNFPARHPWQWCSEHNVGDPRSGDGYWPPDRGGDGGR